MAAAVNPTLARRPSDDYRVEAAVLLGLTGFVLGAVLGGYGDADNGNRPSLLLVGGGGGALGALLGYLLGKGIHKPAS